MSLSLRRTLVVALLALALLCAGLSGLGSPPAIAATPQAVWTLKLTERVSLAEFMEHRQRPPVGGLDWSTDGCSSPFPLSVIVKRFARILHFDDACIRHDFCYRNNRIHRPNAWAAGGRLTCDNVFAADMVLTCYTRADIEPCYRIASDFYRAVRAYGG